MKKRLPAMISPAMFFVAGSGADVQLDNAAGSNSQWYYRGNSPINAVPPGWDAAGFTQAPLLSTIDGTTLIVGQNSPLIGRSSASQLTHGVYDVSKDYSTRNWRGSVQSARSLGGKGY